ncbi:trypsin-like serine peptidase [Pendulispora albinea]|uniref:Serine protease n=1 Tax=Pendulispora albinea TaxID=2741071 RepID=A0ABZ2LNB8_9BACT
MNNGHFENIDKTETTSTDERVVDELGGQESSEEASGEGAEANAHAPVAYTIRTALGTSPKQGDEGNGETDEGFAFRFGPASVDFEPGVESGSSEESQFEAVEGWDESSLTEAAAEEAAEEAAVDAWYAEATKAEQEEFFAFMAPLVLPLVKSAIPALAGAAVRNLPKLVGPVMQRLGGRRRSIRRGTETTREEANVVDEAALDAIVQQLEVIIGKDDRVQIVNSNAVPWKRICHLQIESADGGRFLGSGALVGPRTVVTAGHCVYMHTQGGWARSITVTPGRNGSNNSFGQCKAVGLRSVRGWVNMRKREYDYAAIILPYDYAKKQRPSAFGFATYSDTVLKSARLNLAGYPGDRPAGTIWYHGRKAKAVKSQTLIYDIDSMGGQSGSPVWVRLNEKRIMVGIHTNGSPNGNSATRITQPVFENLQRWRKEGL